ncbi:MAG: hypothetical protein U2P89_15055 [Proteiniphilum sp.]|uniref:hypothetical protein n=1 Tax=Proteiniphilum sp. TaxID=1926877 RepID=UPI002ABB0A48|nr:hypothetical protein [Proteiniphilum sp.]MDY9920167.1 hypothetical protein [Proteiniphilum sp.]
MGKISQDVRLIIPKADMRFFRELADKMGWSFEVKEDTLKKYIASRPKDVRLSDEEILSEVEAVRYGR